MTRRRIIAYVDGYNLYYGLKRKDGGSSKHLWLDIRALFEALCRPDDELVMVKYFTAISRHSGSAARQQRYLSALELRGGLEIHLGRISPRPHTCPSCEKASKREQEKETDVGMATAMLLDAFNAEADEMWLMTRDSDLAPAVEAVVGNFGLKVLVVPPPGGGNEGSGADRLVAASGGARFHVEPRLWKKCQLPDALQKAKGSPRIRRPEEWK